jgi:hypothetical protein
MRPVSDKEFESVTKLPAPKRYDYSVKTVVDWEQMWGLRDDGGWATVESPGGVPVFPLWPAKRYADACASEDWAGMVAEAFSVDDFVKEMAPSLRERGMLPGVFFTADQGSVNCQLDELLRDLGQEGER